jgi:hypothetical protein
MKAMLKKFFNFDFMQIILDLIFVIGYVNFGVASGDWVDYLCCILWGMVTILNGITWWLKYWKQEKKSKKSKQSVEFLRWSETKAKIYKDFTQRIYE